MDIRGERLDNSMPLRLRNSAEANNDREKTRSNSSELRSDETSYNLRYDTIEEFKVDLKGK